MVNADWTSIGQIATVASAIAAMAAAVASWRSAASAKSMVGLEQSKERASARLLKNRFEIDNLLRLIEAFTELYVLADRARDSEEQARLQRSIEEIDSRVAVLKSLGTPTSDRIDGWSSEKAPNGQSLARLAHYMLGQLGVKAEEEDRAFLGQKVRELCRMRDSLFESEREE